jgi:hypothetical protein
MKPATVSTQGTSRNKSGTATAANGATTAFAYSAPSMIRNRVKKLG